MVARGLGGTVPCRLFSRFRTMSSRSLAPQLAHELPDLERMTSEDKLGRSREELAGLRQANAATLAGGAVDIPCRPTLMGPRVEHLVCHRDGQALEVLQEALWLPREFLECLVWMGAVYYCPVQPAPPTDYAARNSEEHLSRLLERRAAAIADLGADTKLQTPRRMLERFAVREGGYVRAHLHPKRFPAAFSTDWASRVIAEGDLWVAVDKPRGVQVVSTVDQVRESVLWCVWDALGRRGEPLCVTSRLDRGTEGVLLLGRGSKGAAAVNNVLQGRTGTITKHYRCLTEHPAPLGPLTHWGIVGFRLPGLPVFTRIVPEGTDGAKDCRLVVHESKRVRLGGEARAMWGHEAWETSIELITGRTHQIRAQMAAVGLPLLGDTMYATLLRVAPSESLVELRDSDAIALQASMLDVRSNAGIFGEAGDGRVRFQARLPWWRAGPGDDVPPNHRGNDVDGIGWDGVSSEGGLG